MKKVLYMLWLFMRIIAITIDTFTQANDAQRALDWLFSHPDETGEESSESAQKETPGGKYLYIALVIESNRLLINIIYCMNEQYIYIYYRCQSTI